jgi:signal transduction histidine kinase
LSGKSRFHSIYWRQFSLTAGMVLLTLLLLGTSFFTLTYTYIMSEKKEELQEKAVMMAELSATYSRDYPLYSPIFGGENQGIRIIAQVASSLSDIDFLIWDTQSNTLLTTDNRLEGQEVALPAKITDKVLAGGSYAGMTALNIYPSSKYVVAVPIYAVGTGDIQGMVLAVTEAQSLTGMWRGFLGIFAMTSITVLLIAFVASSITAMQQTRPIQEMAAAARRFAEGNFDARVQPTDRDDEVEELAEAFNAMAESLQQTERQRREFIANISHELKTPMTTITGYADGILDGTIPPEREGQYLRIISDESRRLSRLVRRMLEVSQLQSVDLLREKGAFDLCESMRRALISMEMKITDRNLDVEADIPEESVLVLGDNDLITQVIYNLLENAAKFATAGSALYLGLSLRGEKAEVTVRNHGATIDAEELPRLFERFHKSDKSRSEDKDGVGLGLYIVKTILEQHREHIYATSEEGLTTFTFTMTLAGNG